MGNYESKDLFKAIQENNRKATKRIIKSSKTRFEYVLDEKGCPPICLAAKLGYEDIIALLIKHGFKAHVPDDRCWFPLHYAANGNHSGSLYVLLSRGEADVRKRCPVVTCNCDKQTALHAAALNGSYKAVETLLQYNCDVTAGDRDGLTAAEVATKAGHTQIADLIQRTENLRS